MFEIDVSTKFGSRVAHRLEAEEVIWLVTTDPGLTPQPVPVWFYWNGESFLIFSQPEAKKLRNIRQHAGVALHFNSNAEGDDIIVFTGEAQILQGRLQEAELEAYLQKYEQGLKNLEMDAQGFLDSYSVAVRVFPRRLRGF